MILIQIKTKTKQKVAITLEQPLDLKKSYLYTVHLDNTVNKVKMPAHFTAYLNNFITNIYIYIGYKHT